MTNRKQVTEPEARKAMHRAFKDFLKDMESEPSSIIIEEDREESLSYETAGEIQEWLFRRRKDNGNARG